MQKELLTGDGEQRRTACALWLYTIPGIGKAGRKRLLDYAGEEREVYALEETQLPGLLTRRQQEMFLLWRREHQPEELLEKLSAEKIHFIPWFGKSYPKRLSQIPDAPYAVYVKGSLPRDECKSVAIVGARACSEYGRRMARWFAKELAAGGVQIISGLARGIDGISQQAALEAGGKSFAVLGCGVGICYPPENRSIYEGCLQSGGILSEYPPQTEPKAGFFPARNRIISGLADALLVIEARERSGTLITVDMALEQGREVFAVPGRAAEELSLGCNRLIRQGASMASGPEDLLECLGMSSALPADGGRKERASRDGGKDGEKPDGVRHRLAWELLEDNPQPLSVLQEALSRQPGMESVTLAETAGLLADLELDGFAGEKSRNYYYRRNPFSKI